jgi:aromatic-L-amino-acid/L-tryptophan decarboxylase
VVDDLPAIEEVCRRHGMWLHVDGAYGAFAVLTSRGKAALKGLELADSVTMDPHKWLYQPFECGAVLVRNGALLREAFEVHPTYLQDTASRNGEVNLAEQGLQLTRMSRALKLWLSLRYFGVDAFAAAIDRALDITLAAQSRIEASPELELLTPATLGIVCFRRHPAGVDGEQELEHLNTALLAALAESGHGLVSSTRLRGRYAVRLCVLNHSTGPADVDAVLDWLERAPAPPYDGRTRRSGASALETRTADLTVGWPGAVGAEPEQLRSVPLLADVSEEVLGWVATVGRRRHVAAGDVVIRQWDVDRDFYLLLSGEADVLSEDRLLTTMRDGDFFGEVAALDWGASFGYPRLATVCARSDLVLLALTDAELAELMRSVPAIDRRVRAAAAERATRL